MFINHKTIVAWEGETQGTAGIKDNRGNISDQYNGIAHLNVGHDWGGFIVDNTLGKSIDGTWIIETRDKEIKYEIFNKVGYKSCVDNHSFIENWLVEEGING